MKCMAFMLLVVIHLSWSAPPAAPPVTAQTQTSAVTEEDPVDDRPVMRMYTPAAGWCPHCKPWEHSEDIPESRWIDWDTLPYRLVIEHVDDNWQVPGGGSTYFPCFMWETKDGTTVRYPYRSNHQVDRASVTRWWKASGDPSRW